MFSNTLLGYDPVIFCVCRSEGINCILNGQLLLPIFIADKEKLIQFINSIYVTSNDMSFFYMKNLLYNCIDGLAWASILAEENRVFTALLCQ